MHELAIAEKLVGVIKEEAAKNDVKTVKHVRLEIGALSNIVPDALSFCYDVATRGTVAEKSKLDIIHKPGIAICDHCGERNEVSDFITPCAKCDSFKLRIVDGNSIQIKDMEVE